MSENTLSGDLHVVCFELAEETYAVDIGAVHEIIRVQAVTPIPNAPTFVEGVINLRGRVIPVIDLRRRFGLSMMAHTRATRIAVVELGPHLAGLIVDGVSQVLRIASASIEPPPPLVTSLASEYLRGIAKLDDGLVVLLDLNRILDADQTTALDALVAHAA